MFVYKFVENASVYYFIGVSLLHMISASSAIISKSVPFYPGGPGIPGSPFFPLFPLFPFDPCSPVSPGSPFCPTFPGCPVSPCAGMTCEIGTVNKMAAGKLLLFFLPLHPSKTGLLQERLV